jgi:ribonuclease T2
MRWVIVWLALAGMARAEGERAGDFDYYVMALSWSANWCALEGDARRDAQCAPGRGFDFVLHGLWPQYEDGWPSYCRTAERDPSRGESEAMADVMGGSGAAWYQWKKHGRCAGLPARAYYALMRQAVARVAVPDVFQRLRQDVRLPASVVEEAFLEANPSLAANGVAVTCRDGHVQEVRICLTKDLTPRACGADVARECRLRDAVMEAVR